MIHQHNQKILRKSSTDIMPSISGYTKKELRGMGCTRYGYIGKVRRRVGKAIVVIALLPLFSLWLLPVGLRLLGATPSLMFKTLKIQVKERLRLL